MKIIITQLNGKIADYPQGLIESGQTRLKLPDAATFPSYFCFRLIITL